MAQNPLILASGSKYRAELLSRLQLPFIGIAPNLDESALPDEPVQALTQRLALAKARALVSQYPNRWVLGSDQAASAQGRILGKPGTMDRAAEQLGFLSGKAVEFLTAVALVRDDQVFTALDVTTVQFRVLNSDEITRYLNAESVLDCAGSFKCEGLGISLFESIRSEDPTGLIGLPLIAVRRLFAQAGHVLP
ncbi:MAG: nucleoside triphosphate pyrophosphatase [Pseudomonadota bacterium]